MEKLAFLGTGFIGAGMVEGLVATGHAVRAWNRSASKAQPLAEQGVEIAASAAEAVRGAQRVHVVLSDDAAVDEVLGGVVSALAPGALVVDHTTTAPGPTAARSQRLEQQGVQYLHAPVFMSPRMCKERQGLILSSGPRARFERAEPWLAGMTGKVWWLGERPELAAAYKLFGNAMILSLSGAIADVLTLGQAVGVAPEQVMELFQQFNPGAGLPGRGSRMARGKFEPDFALSMARKDVRLMLETAGELPLAVLPGLAARMDQLLAAGRGDYDVNILAEGPVKAAQR